MALKDIEVGTAMPADKQYKLTDGNGMHLFVHPNGSKYGDPTPVVKWSTKTGHRVRVFPVSVF